MRNIKTILWGLAALLSVNATAITIEEMAEKNNKIIELDQDIAIAEKNKKLAQLKSEFTPPETVLLPKIVATQRDERISVLSVHGSPADPLVDVQYGDRLLQKRRGEFLPDGWEITAIGHGTVTFQKKLAGKPSAVKTIGIGQGVQGAMGMAESANSPIPAPSH